ncbi:hypothetical protein A5810_003105 [Enterococcus faecium]|uniref:Uncharacterized protein n=1 Tax=Enterococcus faecium TaxID=1352 RepID=A0A242AS39_ENTFC|nr:hypothetical protein A5810_003105 [Enterococcus faecium]
MKLKLMVLGLGILLLLFPFFIMLNMITQMIGSVGATEETSSYSEQMPISQLWFWKIKRLKQVKNLKIHDLCY